MYRRFGTQSQKCCYFDRVAHAITYYERGRVWLYVKSHVSINTILNLMLVNLKTNKVIRGVAQIPKYATVHGTQ